MSSKMSEASSPLKKSKFPIDICFRLVSCVDPLGSQRVEFTLLPFLP